MRNQTSKRIQSKKRLSSDIYGFLDTPSSLFVPHYIHRNRYPDVNKPTYKRRANFPSRFSRVAPLPPKRPRPHLIRPASLSSSHRLVVDRKGSLRNEHNETSPDLMASVKICPHRLIDTHSLEIVEFDEDDIIPPYAIFSHTWGREEIKFDEFVDPHEETFAKLGYWKIWAACRQALADDIDYIWADTCCIEQGNHEDVAANITSMYQYYQNAEICYVYLVDVKSTSTEDMLRTSRFEKETYWFKRGWTLQELLAPRTVIFFNSYWKCVGDKHELREDIHRQTTIPIDVLSGELSIRKVDPFVRMSWATDRRTTRPQDEAYCLQGLLRARVEPDYEEERWAAFNRLGKAFFDSRPKRRKRLGTDYYMLTDPDDSTFYDLLSKKFCEILDKISEQSDSDSEEDTEDEY